MKLLLMKHCAIIIPTFLNASRHFSSHTSFGVPWYSGRSILAETILCGKLAPKIARNSSSFLAFPVTNVIVLEDAIVMDLVSLALKLI